MDALGLNWIGIIFYIISFLIALYVLNKFVFSQIAIIMNERERTLKDALIERDQIHIKLQEVNLEAQAIISEAKVEARNIINSARDGMEPQKRRVLEQAEDERTQIIFKAQNESREIIETAQAEAKSEAVTVVEAVIQKSLANLKIDNAAANTLLAKIINNI